MPPSNRCRVPLNIDLVLTLTGWRVVIGFGFEVAVADAIMWLQTKCWSGEGGRVKGRVTADSASC